MEIPSKKHRPTTQPSTRRISTPTTPSMQEKPQINSQLNRIKPQSTRLQQQRPMYNIYKSTSIHTYQFNTLHHTTPHPPHHHTSPPLRITSKISPHIVKITDIPCTNGFQSFRRRWTIEKITMVKRRDVNKSMVPKVKDQVTTFHVGSLTSEESRWWTPHTMVAYSQA